MRYAVISRWSIHNRWLTAWTSGSAVEMPFRGCVIPLVRWYHGVTSLCIFVFKYSFVLLDDSRIFISLLHAQFILFLTFIRLLDSLFICVPIYIIQNHFSIVFFLYQSCPILSKNYLILQGKEIVRKIKSNYGWGIHLNWLLAWEYDIYNSSIVFIKNEWNEKMKEIIVLLIYKINSDAMESV